MAGMAGMADMPGMDMAGMGVTWDLRDVVLLWVMWAVMMVAMMAPSAAPMLLTFTAVNAQRGRQGRAVVSSQVFLSGYFIAWSVFSAVAVAAQWELHRWAILSDTMVLSDRAWSGALLIVAGIYQWTPLKHACLSRCRSPLTFLMSGWREDARGAFVMGLRHGFFCVGCCWTLMALLFVAGVMNLLWVAAIAMFVLIERVVPRGEIVARVAGVGLVVAGLVLLR